MSAPVSADRTSELTWYSRTTVLGGCLVLVVQAVTQRGVGIVTVLAVLAVSLGLVAFVWGLIADARGPGTVTAEPAEPVGAEVVDRVSTETSAPSAAVTPEETPVPEEIAPPAAPTIPPAAASDRVRTFRVGADDAAASLQCPACDSEIGSGHIAAVCPVCGSVHHASCWIDADFHCAVEGCTGGGSLERPERSPRPGRGPSKP